jgi:hypothetical protein
MPAPRPAIPAPPPLPPRPVIPDLPNPPLKSGNPRAAWLVVGFLTFCLLCVAAVAGLLFVRSARPDIINQIIQFTDKTVQVEEATIDATPTPVNTPIVAAQITQSIPVEPPAPAITQTASERTIQTFADTFSSLSTGWPQLDDDVCMTGYSEGGMYGIGLKHAEGFKEVRIPHGIQLPLTETSIYFRARQVAGKGYFGVLCDYTDQNENNEVMIAITEGAYQIARYLNGEEHYYLETPWVNDRFIKSEDGEFQVAISCGNTIILMVNGYTLPSVDNPNRILGDIALFAVSDDKAILDGYFFYQVLFDDVEMSAR